MTSTRSYHKEAEFSSGQALPAARSGAESEGQTWKTTVPARLFPEGDLWAGYLRVLARLALGATIVAIPLRYRLPVLERSFPPIYRDYTNLLLFASDILLVAMLILWGLSLALAPRSSRRGHSPRRGRRLRTGPLLLSLPIAGVTGMGLVSVVFSVDPLLSLYHSIRLLLLGGLYLYILNEITGLGEIMAAVAIQVFIQAAVGIGQVWQQHSLGLQSLGELELDPAWNGVSIVWAEGVRSLRAYGLTDHPNILGGCFAFGLILVASWYLSPKGTYDPSPFPSPDRGGVRGGVGGQSESKWRALSVSLFGLGSLGLLLTFSRSAWLALGGGLLTTAFLLFRTRQAHVLRDGLTLILAGLILVLPFLLQNTGYLGMRFNLNASFTPGTPENRSIAERETLNSAVNLLFAENALKGVGLGALPLALRERFPDFPIDYQPAHIVLLDVAAETGILGALWFMIALGGPWLALWLNRRRLAFSPALVGVTGVLMATTLVSFFDYYTWLLAPGRLWLWLVWGLWGALYQSSLDKAVPDA